MKYEPALRKDAEVDDYEYTQEMRINGQSCPLCGFWHSGLSCPPQVGALSHRLKSDLTENATLRSDLAHVTAERDKLRKVIENLKMICMSLTIEAVLWIEPLTREILIRRSENARREAKQQDDLDDKSND